LRLVLFHFLFWHRDFFAVLAADHDLFTRTGGESLVTLFGRADITVTFLP
jgi:hypothetical protein